MAPVMKIRFGSCGVVIAAGVILFTLGSAPAARASCGHYVSFGGQQKTQPESAGKQDRPAPIHPAPCSGPRCSQGQPPLTPPPAAPPSLENDRWSLPWLGQAPPADSHCWFGSDPVPAHPLASRSPVYHPPR